MWRHWRLGDVIDVPFGNTYRSMYVHRMWYILVSVTDLTARAEVDRP